MAYGPQEGARRMTDQTDDRDPFSSGGRLFSAGAEQPALRSAGRVNDRMLVEAEHDIAELRAQDARFRAAGDDSDHPEIWDQIFKLERKIARLAPGSLSGAAVKLRRLADPKLGIAAGLVDGDDDLSVAQICAVVERLVEQGVDGRVIPGDADETIRALFLRWITAHASADKIDKSIEAQTEYDAAVERICALEHQIADIPASGPVGLAIKCYLARYYHDEDGPRQGIGHPAALAPLSAETYGEHPELFVGAHCVLAVIRDAARFVPEMARLVDPLIGARRGRAEKGVADPKQITDTWFSYLDEDAEMPISMRLADGTYRRGTEGELADHLRYRPSDYKHVAPAVLRRLMPDEDGELFALFVERRLIERRDKGSAADLEENLRRICETPAVTDAGVVAKLRLLFDSSYDHGPRLSPVQQRQLSWAAIAWLYHPGLKDDRVPMELRALDTRQLGDELRSYDRGEPGSVAGGAA
jgi:hypothetical protein